MRSRQRHVPFSQRHIAPLLQAFPSLGPRLDRWESAAVADDIEVVGPGAPVWICGMARSGSTILLEILNGLPEFTSHRYSDYPWLWTPYWWNHLQARLPMRPMPRRERAHRDRIEITRDSPEAFEEIFWMRYFPDRHDPAVDQVLDVATRHPEFERFFDMHQRKLLAVRGARRYLAKANYQLARLGYLHRLYPQARFVIPVREPLAQVASLIKQDRLFCRLDREDPAVSAHLARIGHYEFGPHKRAFHLGDALQTAAITACFARGALAEGYARQWLAHYGHALACMRADATLVDACLWISYDRLCANPQTELERLAVHLALEDSDCDALVSTWSPRLNRPDYYAPAFAADEAEKVRELAAPLWAELQSLAS
jgi:hypothetical protein